MRYSIHRSLYNFFNSYHRSTMLEQYDGSTEGNMNLLEMAMVGEQLNINKFGINIDLASCSEMHLPSCQQDCRKPKLSKRLTSMKNIFMTKSYRRHFHNHTTN